MNFALSSLFAALVVSMAVGKPAPQIRRSSLHDPNIEITYTNLNGVQELISTYSRHSENFPTEWTAEFIYPVSRPQFYNISDDLLAQMDDRNSWDLKPNPSSHFDDWNVLIRIPNEWRLNSNRSMEQTYSDSTGVIMAITYNLTPTRAGTAVIESHFGNYHYRNPVNLEIDPTKPISLMYSNDKLVVTFSTRLIKQS